MLRLVEPQVEVSDKKCIGIMRKLQPVSGGQIVRYLLLNWTVHRSTSYASLIKSVRYENILQPENGIV